MNATYKHKKKRVLFALMVCSTADQFTGVVSGEGLSGQIEQRPARSEGI